jgi:hypothetical protein
MSETLKLAAILVAATPFARFSRFFRLARDVAPFPSFDRHRCIGAEP